MTRRPRCTAGRPSRPAALRAAGGLLVLLTWATAGCTEQVTSTREPVLLREVQVLGLDLIVSVPTCGGEPSAEVIESPTEVRLVVSSTVRRGGAGGDCADGLSVRLREPLGERRVSDQLGRTLPVVRP